MSIHEPEVTPGSDSQAHSSETGQQPMRRSSRKDHAGSSCAGSRHLISRAGRRIATTSVSTWNKAAKADGAGDSGLTALIYPTMINSAIDAALMVALANTLFVAAAQAESKSKVALYLLVNIAPFAVIAPFIGPMLDKIQHGRRVALAASFLTRLFLALLLISNSFHNPISGATDYDPWVLYPSALCMMVLSKSFSVLKSSVAPRVLPPSIDLVRVNSRLTIFALVGGSIVGGGLAAGFEFGLGKTLHIPGALVFLSVMAVAGIWTSLRIPSWVENTSGEVPATVTESGALRKNRGRRFKVRQPFGQRIITGLWGNVTIRFVTGFLTLYIAFYAKAQQQHGISGFVQLAMIGAVGASAGVGNFLGNTVGARLALRQPSRLITSCACVVAAFAIAAAVMHNLIAAVIFTFVASFSSAFAKVCLDASIQDDLPDASRASGFGVSETILQLGWVLGAAFGVVLPANLMIGFLVIAIMTTAGAVATVSTTRGGFVLSHAGRRI